MIIELTVANFRSIKNEQTFSLYAETLGSCLSGNTAQSPNAGNINILKTVGVYGANASGKSNLLLAFRALKNLISSSGKLSDGEPLSAYQPYLLSDRPKLQPVLLEIEFVVPKGERFRYRVVFLEDQIIEERLIAFLTAKESLVFDRKKNDTWDTIKFGTLYKGGAKRIPFFKNQAYLSMAGNSADAPEMIRKIYDFFRKDLVHLGPNQRVRYPGLAGNNSLLKKVSSLLSFVDTGVSEVVAKENKLDDESMKFPPDIPAEIKENILRDMRWRYLFSHPTEAGITMFFEREAESAGTVKLLDLAPLLIDALETGGVLVLDELDNSMHPFMAELIIKLFNDSEINPYGAQLIFSTHNINLMSPDHMRRDQIWFAEKSGGASRFYSLDDFDKKKVTPTSPFNKWYADGRFGAVPQIDYQGILRLFKKGSTHAKA